MWDDSTYLIHFIVEVWEWINNFIPSFIRQKQYFKHIVAALLVARSSKTSNTPLLSLFISGTTVFCEAKLVYILMRLNCIVYQFKQKVVDYDGISHVASNYIYIHKDSWYCVQYIPWNMHMALLWFLLLCLHYLFWQIHVLHLPIAFPVASLALGQFYDKPVVK